jgi:hypothetical protein
MDVWDCQNLPLTLWRSQHTKFYYAFSASIRYVRGVGCLLRHSHRASSSWSTKVGSGGLPMFAVGETM